LALTYIEEPKVDRWSQAYANKLAGQVYGTHGQLAQYCPEDEALWNEFVVTFQQQYHDTAKVE